METDKPLISILMAVYEPNLDWLSQQLASVEDQTYSNVRLYICDDCSSIVSISEIETCVRSQISRIPYTITRNQENLGSNKTFERLTQEAEGEYFAYCDQDDIWLPYKLDTLQAELEHTGALLVCSDMYVIDAAGKRRANGIRKIRRHHVFKSGSGLAEGLLFRNFVTGCTMLVRAKDAKSAVPFCPYMVHDHYLALCCAAQGNIQSVCKPLIQYRIHADNQTSLLAGVNDKKSYGKIRIDEMLNRFRWLNKNFPFGSELKNALAEGNIWLEARADNWHHAGGRAIVWKYRKFGFLPSLFEIVAAGLPEPIFRIFLVCGKRNWI